jgi:hypothetical protein
MIVAIPGAVVDGDETTTAKDDGWAAGPEELMGVITDRYALPQPAIRAAAENATPALTNRARVWPEFMNKSLIQIFPAYPVIVNQ